MRKRVVSLWPVWGWHNLNDLDSLRDFQLNYALHNTYSTN